MRILIEEHQYPASLVNPVLEGISNLRDVDGRVSVNYVGYFYNPRLRDCVFILPKVLMEGELVFGHCAPEDIIDIENQTLLSSEEYKFIYELSVWIYRAICVYRDSAIDNTIIRQQIVPQMNKGRLHQCNTFLDILLALQKFNRENQDFFFFVLRNIHSGYNKINWTRTISHSNAVVQQDTPIYLNPVNKKRKINFDEELLIIFFSILNYMRETYGFPVQINVNFQLITGEMFKNYMEGMGKIRMVQIKYKYFSDKALYLWELCYAFFDQSKKINVETDDKEYLLAQNFNIVFEAIIDELIGDRKSIPNELMNQGDGKRVDHMYQYKNLTNNEDEKTIYYIGDSKYYKRRHEIGKESVYKQFTYARNVIQWNLDLFNDGKEEEQKGHLKLRDDETEGYNIIPNFFISAEQKTLDKNDSIQKTDNVKDVFSSRQFENRLFDRDTFLIAHYDVNFLFVVALYGRNDSGEKTVWRKKIREMFRKDIQNMLEKNFSFHVMAPHLDVNASAYIEDHFQQLLGKVFTPYDNSGVVRYYSLALSNDAKFKDENEALIAQLEDSFYVKSCNIGDNPSKILKDVMAVPVDVVSRSATTTNFLTMHYLEKYLDKKILIGCYKSQEHLDWILGKNDRGTLIYNVRLGKDVAGGQVKAQLDKMVVSFVIIYEYGKESENNYRVFHVHHHATMTADRLKKSLYPSEPNAEKYFCYVFDEEVTLGNLDITGLVSQDGSPVFVTGEDMMKRRK
ncbi:MAG: restriction endonuclease [Paludibacteraceae bacterium]|nr:restriction endonuclease [Paludibacteraceae bacterium]